MRQVKSYVELQNYNEITSFSEPERVISSFMITDQISNLASRIIADLSSPRQSSPTGELPSLHIITGQRGVGKSHLLAFLKAIIGNKNLRSLIADSNILNAIGYFGDKPLTTIEINFAGFEREPFEARLRSALCATLKQASYFDDEKWAAAIQGEQVFEQALGALPLGAQIILFVDNLSQRWRMAPEQAESDLDWLALLARQSVSLPLRALIVRDEDGAGSDGSNPSNYSISPDHINQLIARKVLRKTPQQTKELEEVHNEMLQLLPTFSYSSAELAANYPLHPVISELSGSFRQAAQSFSLPSFAAASAGRVMSRPATSLVTPVEIFDKYEYDFRKYEPLSAAFKLYDQIISTAISKLPVSERLWAKLVLKTFFLYSAAGKPATAQQLTNAQMLYIEGSPLDGYEKVSRILEVFVQHCPEAINATGVGTNCGYLLASASSTDSNIEVELAKLSREIASDDPRLSNTLFNFGSGIFTDFACQISFPYIEEPSFEREFIWRGSYFKSEVSLSNNFSADTKWKLKVLPFHLAESEKKPDTLYDDPETLYWHPGAIKNKTSLSPLKKILALNELVSSPSFNSNLVSDEFEKTKELLLVEVQDLFKEQYLREGKFSFLQESETINMLVADAGDFTSAPVSFSDFLPQAFDGLLTTYLPHHPEFETLPTESDVQRLFADFYGGSEEVRNQEDTQKLVAQFAVPLGLVTKQNEKYQLDIFNSGSAAQPFVQVILGQIDHQAEESGIAAVSLKPLQETMSQAPYGLTKTAFQIVLGALVDSKLVELINDSNGDKLTKDELKQFSSLEVFTSIQRTQSVSYPPNIIADWARNITGNPDLPPPLTPDSENRIREALKKWLADWEAQKLTERFEAMPMDLLTLSSWRALEVSKQRFARASSLVEAAVEERVDIGTALSRIADIFGFDKSAMRRTQDEMKGLSGFLDWMPGFSSLRNYLLAAEPTSDQQIEQLRSELSTQVLESKNLLDTELRRALEIKFSEYRKRYSEFYSASHEANVGPTANRELISGFCASAEWSQFRMLMNLKMEGGSFERDAQMMLNMAQETRCDLPVMELLQHQPQCCCSFRLHRKVHLGSLLDALKSIASAASTYYSLAIWRHRSELRTKVKEIDDQALQFELEDFLAACGSGSLSDLTPELVNFINDTLCHELSASTAA